MSPQLESSEIEPLPATWSPPISNLFLKWEIFNLDLESN